MFEIRIVLALALLCLQVSGTPPGVYGKLCDCFQWMKKPFQDFFPLQIAKFPFVYSNFTGEFKNVSVFGLNFVRMEIDHISNDSDGTVLVELTSNFPRLTLSGTLIGSPDSEQFDGPVTGYLAHIYLNANVSYRNQQVTDLKMVLWIYQISVVYNNQAIPFTDIEILEHYNAYLVSNKNAIEKETLALINARIDTPEKFASLKADCGIE